MASPLYVSAYALALAKAYCSLPPGAQCDEAVWNDFIEACPDSLRGQYDTFYLLKSDDGSIKASITRDGGDEAEIDVMLEASEETSA